MRHLTTALALCALTSVASAADLQPIVGDGATPPAPWHVLPLPNSPNKPLTHFSVETVQGKRALRIEADKSYANLVHELPPTVTGRVLSWSWLIDELNDAADLHNRSGDDTTVKVCALFDMPLDKVPFIERQLLSLARSKTTDPIPAATICYVWDDKLPVGTWIDSPFTHRLHYLVLESGADHANEWHSEKRDLAADFLKAFGAEDAEVPPLVGIAVGADADNTQRHSVAHVTDVELGH
jgi:Protein of unknown function (DUF3047)